MAITSKMIGARGRRQAEKLGIDPSRVPSGQYLTEKFPVLTVGRNPRFDLADWELRVDGEVESPLTLSWEALKGLPQAEVTVDIHCVTRWSKLDTVWRGVRVRDLLERVAPTDRGTHLMAHCDGGYTTNLTLDTVMADEVLVAHTYAGKPLEPDHGAPLRLLVPKRYFWKSAKFLRRLEVMSGDRMGFWELNGYHNDADPWQEQRHWF